MKRADKNILTLPTWQDEFPGLTRQFTRHGKEVWYVRPKHHGERIRIRAPFGTEAFRAEYDSAVRGGAKTPQDKLVEDRKTLAWLITEYRTSPDWRGYGDETKYQREYYLQKMQTTSGHERYRDVSRKMIIEARDKLEGAAARHFVDTVRGLFKWAEFKQYIPADPTLGVKHPKKKKTGGFRTWTEEEVAQYERFYPLGTKERVWFAVLQFLGGPRRGDAAALGKQHVRKGPAGLEVVFKTEKSQRQKEVTIPLLPEFVEVIKAGPVGETTFICGANGRALSKETFGNYFREACNAAGLAGLTAHGVRKAMATRMADRGASDRELMAIFGWSDPRMPTVYTQAADTKRLSRRTVALLAPPSDQDADYLTLAIGSDSEKNRRGPPSPSQGEGEMSGKPKQIR